MSAKVIYGLRKKQRLSGRRAFRFDGNRQPECLQHFQNRSKLGIAFRSKGLIEALAGKTGIFGNLRHTARARHCAERLGKEGWIGVFHRYLHGLFKIFSDCLVILKVFSRIVGKDLQRHLLFLQLLVYRVGLCDIRILTALIAAAKQKNQHRAALYEVDAISRPKTNPQFTHAVTDWFDVSRIPIRKTIDASRNCSPGTPIVQAAQPLGKHLGLANRDHFQLYLVGYKVSTRPSSGNRQETIPLTPRPSCRVPQVSILRPGKPQAPAFSAVCSISTASGSITASAISVVPPASTASTCSTPSAGSIDSAISAACAGPTASVPRRLLLSR